MREKQIGVTLTAHSKTKLDKVARLQGRSKSSVAAQAIEMYLDSWIAEQASSQSSTIFSGVKKTASQMMMKRSEGIARL